MPINVFHSFIYNSFYSFLTHSASFSHTLYLHVCAGRSDVRIQPGTAGCDHFGRYFLTAQVRMML